MEQTAERRVRVIPAMKKEKQAPAGQTQGRKRVAAYCRVSTDTEEQLNSYAAQKAYYTQLIEENPEWEMAGVFADEGLSGTGTKKRVQFNRMIAACKRGRIDVILTKSLSRFARNTVDCLETVRVLKAQGIGVIFEKENINTLTESSEFLITLFSGFAQAESESLSRNVSWGIQKSMEAGKATFHYDRLLGYRKGADGSPEIDPEEAQTVKIIYRRYLEGASLGKIQQELEADAVPTAKAIKGWSRQVIQNILTNEKYIGDVLLQKSFVADCISKKVKKNQGERPMYYVENHHPAIISKDIFHRVKEEMTRRASKRKILQKSGKTEQGKYSAKYALSERLVCGECGSPYKRCTWVKKGEKQIVWRCVSRLEFGTKHCHNSPTIREEQIHNAIVAALNEFAVNREEMIETASEIASLVKTQEGETDGVSLMELRRRLDALTAEQTLLLDQILEDMDNPVLNTQLKNLASKKQEILKQIEEIREQATRQANQESRMAELREWLEQETIEFTDYDDTITRRLVERITVTNLQTIRVKIRDVEMEIEQRLQ